MCAVGGLGLQQPWEPRVSSCEWLALLDDPSPLDQPSRVAAGFPLDAADGLIS
jgi:hypothetical protein